MSIKRLSEIIETAPQNLAIQNMLLKVHMQLGRYRNAMVSVSGGSDSDIMLDAIERIGHEHCKVTYVFFDTGLEYKATKEHINDLEKKYGIRVETFKPKKPIPASCAEHGTPFLSKYISNCISRLQKHGFRWEDKHFDDLYVEYPNCKAALRWWCNGFEVPDGKKSKFNINNDRWLKEFMIENPPDFKISKHCCTDAKVNTALGAEREFEPDIKFTGLRRAEGGQRSTIYKNCFSAPTGHSIAHYRPLFFMSDKDKREYKEHYGLLYSDCYEVYGLKRTGCVGCPLGSRFENEIEILRQYEPQLYKAAVGVFRKSYEYIREYRKYKARRDLEERRKKDQVAGQCEMEEVKKLFES